MGNDFVNRYPKDPYMQALRKCPYNEISQFFALPKEIQGVIVMNFHNQWGNDAWNLKINDLKETIKFEERDMWIEIDSLMN